MCVCDIPHPCAILMAPGRAEQSGELSPNLLAGGVAFEHDVFDERAGEPSAPRPDIDLDPVVLDVGACREDQAASGYPRREIFPPLIEPLPIRRFAAFLPRLAEQRVLCGLERRIIALGGFPFAGNFGPAKPAHRRLEPGNMKADAMRISRRRGGAPFTRRQHRRLVVLGDRLIAALAVIGGARRLTAGPLQALELEPLQQPAMRARHEESTLIARFEFAFDPRQALDRRCRDQKHLGQRAR